MNRYLYETIGNRPRQLTLHLQIRRRISTMYGFRSRIRQYLH